MKILLQIAAACLLLCRCSAPLEVDLIVHNARIYTVNDQFDVAEAMAVSKGLIVAVGAENEILNGYTAKKTIDAEKAVIYPGFIDAHCHFLGYGLSAKQIDLSGAPSFQEVVKRTLEYAATHPEGWIEGRGWDQSKWGRGFDEFTDTLNHLLPDRFICLKRVDGHAAWVSENLISKAGFSKGQTLGGGAVDQPRGLVFDEALSAIEALRPPQSKQDLAAALTHAEKACLAHGLTTVSDAGLNPAEIQQIADMQHRSELKIRLYAMYSTSTEVFRSLPSLAIETDRLTARSVKIYADGALGSRGALLSQAYADSSRHHGFQITSADSLRSWAARCASHNFQMNVHCIGDSAIGNTLRAMATALSGPNDKRWRIEHSQVVNPLDLPLFGQYNVVPSVQPTHAISDMAWAAERLGAERLSWAYAYQSLCAQNGMIALGTDFPVEPIDPRATFATAVFRTDAQGNPADGFLPAEALTPQQALRGMTIWAAMANFQDHNRGSIEAGKFADFIVTNTDLMDCTAQQARGLKVHSTWINGIAVFENP